MKRGRRYGEITSEPWQDDLMSYSEDKVYPWRCRVAFEKADAKVSARDELWGLSPYYGLNTTTPTNMIFSKGGFVEISKADYARLVAMVDG